MVHFTTNSDGLIPASARREKTIGVSRIMIFGDSFVVGRDLPRELTYAARLEELLTAAGQPTEVINAGVLGYSTDQALLAMKRWLPVYRPNIVVYGFTKNDLGGNSLVEAYGQAKPSYRVDPRAGLRLLLPRLDERVRPIGSGPKSWLQHSALYRWLQPSILAVRARIGGWERRALLGTADRMFVDPSTLDAFDWTLLAMLLREMKRTATRWDARFVLFSHPEIEEVWQPVIRELAATFGIEAADYDPYVVERRLARIARQESIDFLPLVGRFVSRQELGPFHSLPLDRHLNERGHELVARELARHLDESVPAPGT